MTRETKEETGLTVAWVIREVGRGTSFETTRNGGITIKWLKVTFVVEIEEIEYLEREVKKEYEKLQDKAQGNIAAHEADQHAETSSQLRKIPVNLNPAEHQRYLWVTEEHVKERDYNGNKLNFVSEDQAQVILEAFETQKHVIAAKANT